MKPSDKSPKGFIDGPILPFMETINKSENYETTSSCSGRVAIFTAKTSTEKGFWTFVSHYKFDIDEEFNVVSEGNESEITMNSNLFGDSKIEFQDSARYFDELQMVSFKFEPFILHIRAKSVELGQKMLQIAIQSGYANSGLVVGKNGCMVQIKSPLKLDTPIGYYSSSSDTYHLIVTKAYIQFLVDFGLSKFQQNSVRMQTLLQNIQQYLNNDHCIKEI